VPRTFDRRDLGDGVRALVPTRLEAAGVHVRFFERTGGASDGPFASLNGSRSGGDDPAAVDENRRRAAASIGVEAFAVPGLVHGVDLEPVDESTWRDGFAARPVAFAAADGLYTDRPGVALGGYSGDCVIAVLASRRRDRIALVHAGWRGLAAGIVARAVRLFDDRAELLIAMGPAIGPCHYEVGPEVVSAVDAGVPGGAVVRDDGTRCFLDLPGSVERVLRAEGATEVDDCGVCPACALDRFYSYRAEGRTGRHLALAVRR
jgi:purine-nucleoside/S-methyl-5'-thioadenosine phosphorylase / adenosine deaminase